MIKTLLICGGRKFNNGDILYREITKVIKDRDDVLFVTGGAKGTDALAWMYAEENDLEIKVFHPNWRKYGKNAGPIRNKEMLDFCLLQKNAMVIAFWDGKSKGTKDMINKATKAGLKVKIVRYTEEDIYPGDPYMVL